jgi:hypothetical protein
MPHPGGRPRIIETPDEFERLTDEYLEHCKKTGEPIGIVGLTLYLGFVDKTSLYEYQQRPEFAHSVRRARSLVEASYEQRLDRDKPQGAIFALKNFGWSDRREVEVRATLGHIDLTKLPDEAVQRIAAGENPHSVLASLAASEARQLPPGEPIDVSPGDNSPTGSDGPDRPNKP